MKAIRISKIGALIMALIMSVSVAFTGGAGSASAAGNTVTFKNGDTVVKSVTVNSGSAAENIGALETDGMLFAGWFTQNVGVISNITDSLNYAYDFSKSVNSDITLYAGWINVGTDSSSRFCLQGVQYRAVTDTYTAGIRFITKIDDSLVNDIVNLNYKNSGISSMSSSDKGIGYGTVLTFAENLLSKNMLVKDESATAISTGFVVVPAVYTYSIENDYRTYTALVVNIPESSYSQHIAARPYITYADANGDTRTYYYTESSDTTHKLGGAYYINYNEAVNNALDDDAIESGNSGEVGDIPQTRDDVQPDSERMYFLLNNKTNGQYADNEVYWCILGYNTSMQLCYVNKDGEMIPATAALNTISKGDRMCADICYSLADADYVYMPDIISGRMYLSYGSPVYITINQDAGGNVGYAGPDLNNTSDPNQDVLFEFIEFTIKGKEYWGNTTRVDFYSFPIVSRLIGSGGYDNYPGDADVYDKTVGDLGTREEMFAAFAAEVPDEFKGLADDYRIMAPCKSLFNEGKQYGNYFDDYIDAFWTKYASEDLVFTCDAGTFRGRVSGDAMIFTKDGDSGTYTIYKPTTQHALEGKGNFDKGSSTEKVIEAQLCAAFNRGVAMEPENWNNSSAFYQKSPCNYYAGFFHNHSYSGLAYGFCYDDVFGYSTLLHYTNPTGLIVDLKW